MKTKPVTSTMFLSSVSVVDHAYIDEYGGIRGNSYNPVFIVRGSVDPTENVVVDFSTVKSSLKKIIDDRATGFDHKLWIINSGTADVCSDCFVRASTTEGYVKITSSSLELEIPEDAVRMIALEGRSMEQYWIDYMTLELDKRHPGINIHVDVKLEMTMTGIAEGCDTFNFNYVHGLRDSTSWGCQNNSHGHLSYIQLLDEEMRDASATDGSEEDNTTLSDHSSLMFRIIERFENAVFIRRENVTLETDDVVTCVYDSHDRGHWFAAYNKHNLNTVVLETETTIEHLVAHMAQSFKTELLNTGARYLAVSEGLTKGALFDLKDFDGQ